MKKKQYTTKQQAAIAARISRKAVEISNTTPHSVFVAYYSHVSWIEVRIFNGGWKRGASPDKDLRVYFACEYRDQEAGIAEVMAALDELQQGAE